MPLSNLPPGLKFGPFSVNASQAFHISPSRLSFALVNIKPLLPGHVLICPVRVVSRLSQLTPNETCDLFLTVGHVSKTLQRVYNAESFNVAVQDGIEAGQSVPHVHVHIIPRRKRDMDDRGGGDAVYELMDGEEGNVGKAFMEMQRWRQKRTEQGEESEFGGPGAEEKRQRRSEDEMKSEADWLRSEIEADNMMEKENKVQSIQPETTT